MKIFAVRKDGGSESTVTGYWLIEFKSLFSIALLRFDNGSRDSFHSHAFNSISWLLSGRLNEQHTTGTVDFYQPGMKPIVTRRSTFHRVFSAGRSWVLTVRGPWAKTWREHDPVNGIDTVLASGREIVQQARVN